MLLNVLFLCCLLAAQIVVCWRNPTQVETIRQFMQQEHIQFLICSTWLQRIHQWVLICAFCACSRAPWDSCGGCRWKGFYSNHCFLLPSTEEVADGSRRMEKLKCYSLCACNALWNGYLKKTNQSTSAWPHYYHLAQCIFFTLNHNGTMISVLTKGNLSALCLPPPCKAWNVYSFFKQLYIHCLPPRCVTMELIAFSHQRMNAYSSQLLQIGAGPPSEIKTQLFNFSYQYSSQISTALLWHTINYWVYEYLKENETCLSVGFCQ